MRLDEEIMYAKKEKEFHVEVSKLLEELHISAEINDKALEESAIPMMKVLKVKHSEPAEMIREADYGYVLDKILREGFTEDEKYFLSNILEHEINDSTKSDFYKEISMLREYVDVNLRKTESEDLSVMMEGYENMAEVYVLFESTREISFRIN